MKFEFKSGRVLEGTKITEALNVIIVKSQGCMYLVNKWNLKEVDENSELERHLKK